jgi:hypothetical protein
MGHLGLIQRHEHIYKPRMPITNEHGLPVALGCALGRAVGAMYCAAPAKEWACGIQGARFGPSRDRVLCRQRHAAGAAHAGQTRSPCTDAVPIKVNTMNKDSQLLRGCAMWREKGH